MKKSTIILTVFAISLLTACGGTQKKQQTAPPADTSAESSSVQEKSDPFPDLSVYDNDAAATVPIEQKNSSTEQELNFIAPAAGNYTPGIIDNNTYRSDWLNLTFQCPEGAAFYPAPNDEYELSCQNKNKSVDVFINVTDFPNAAAKWEDYFTSLKQRITSYTESKYYIFSDNNDAFIGDNTYRAIVSYTKKDDEVFYQTYFIRFIGDKVVNIVISYPESELETAGIMIDSFS